MLTSGEFRFNFAIIKAITPSQILPLDFDGNNKKLKVPNSPWTLRISLGLFGTTIIHSFYILLRLLQVMMHSGEIAKHHLVFHADISLAMFMLEGWFLSCFVLYPETFIALFNDIFTTSDEHGKIAKLIKI